MGLGLRLSHMTIEPIQNAPTQIIESIAGPSRCAVVLILVQP